MPQTLHADLDGAAEEGADDAEGAGPARASLADLVSGDRVEGRQGEAEVPRRAGREVREVAVQQVARQGAERGIGVAARGVAQELIEG